MVGVVAEQVKCGLQHLHRRWAPAVATGGKAGTRTQAFPRLVWCSGVVGYVLAAALPIQLRANVPKKAAKIAQALGS